VGVAKSVAASDRLVTYRGGVVPENWRRDRRSGCQVSYWQVL